MKKLMQWGAALALAVACGGAQAGDAVAAYPQRPVRLIVPYGAGGAADVLARIMAEKLSAIWKQPVIVENKPGGVGTIGIMATVQAEPDGYTLVSVPVSDLAVNPHLYRKRPFDVRKDLAPVSQVGAVPNVLLVSNALEVGDVQALVARAAAKPGNLTYSSPGVGSQAHIAAEMFAMRAGLSLQHIPYNSVPAALTDVAGGQIDMMFAQLPAVLPFVKSGRVKVLAVAADERTPLLPDLPTLGEVGGPSIGDAISWSAVMAPAGTPLALREKIAAGIASAIQSPQVREKLAAQGLIGLGGTPQQLEQAWRQDYERYGAAVKAMNIQLLD